LELTGTEDILRPVVTAEPESQSALAGDSVTLRVEALGASPLIYQWHFNGFAMPQATNATLTLPNLQGRQTGAYFAVVTNFLGAATSAVAFVTVETNSNTAPMLAAIGNKLVRAGGVLTFTAR